MQSLQCRNGPLTGSTLCLGRCVREYPEGMDGLHVFLQWGADHPVLLDAGHASKHRRHNVDVVAGAATACKAAWRARTPTDTHMRARKHSTIQINIRGSTHNHTPSWSHTNTDKHMRKRTQPHTKLVTQQYR